jgi:ketosteroid isomerase-like protein
MTESTHEAAMPAELTARLWLDALRRSDIAALLALYTSDAVLHTDEHDHDSPSAIVDHLKQIAPADSAASGVEALDTSIARAWWSTDKGRELHVNMRVADSRIVEQWIVEHEDFEHPDLHRRHSHPHT